MNHNKWIKRFEKEFGTQKQWMSTLATTPYARRSQLDFYRGLKHFIKSLLKEQREAFEKIIGKDEEYKQDKRTEVGDKTAIHGGFIFGRNLLRQEQRKALSILKGKKK